METKYYICSVGEPKKDYANRNFHRCQEFSAHFMHKNTRYKEIFSKVRPHDIVILKYNHILVAYGEVKDISTEEDPHLGDWNWRINVNEWIWHDDNDHTKGIGRYGVKENVIGGVQYETVKEITPEFGLQKIEQINNGSSLYQNIKFGKIMEKYAALLKSNHNIILHGAPGTGKTYLAQQIAGFLNAETGFVQFHQSYDYTDFVEGLRPYKSSESNGVGFQLMDGTFREFCRLALQNLVDSKKPKEELTTEKLFEDNYYKLIDKIRNGELRHFPQRTSKNIEIIDVSDFGNIILKTSQSESDSTYTVSLDRLKKLAKVFKSKKEVEKIKNIYGEITKVIGGCHSSAYWAVLHYIYNNFSEDIEPVPQIERKNYVFIIDEINRGEMSKIFGELFFSIDPGYRGEKGAVKTQYANLYTSPSIFDDVLHNQSDKLKKEGNGWFFVPENVYIIGTMNDIDRSVESMDFAMRRRFAFIEVKAGDSVSILDSTEAWKTQGENAEMPDHILLKEIKNRMDKLNDAIVSPEVGLSADYQIGGAYFLKFALYAKEEEPFKKLWDNHLAGLLTEYLRGMDSDGTKIKKLEKEYGVDK